MPLTWISLALSRHFSISFIVSGRSSGLHPVSSHSCCMYVLAGCPAFARPYVGVHRSTSLMSSSLLLQQCPVYLVRTAELDKGHRKNFTDIYFLQIIYILLIILISFYPCHVCLVCLVSFFQVWYSEHKYVEWLTSVASVDHGTEHLKIGFVYLSHLSIITHHHLSMRGK